MVTYAKISPKMVNSRDIAGNIEDEECQKIKSEKGHEFGY